MDATKEVAIAQQRVFVRLYSQEQYGTQHPNNMALAISTSSGSFDSSNDNFVTTD